MAADVVYNGELQWSLPGGAIGWAAGGQYREEGFEREVNFFTDIDQNPCVDTLVNGNRNCGTQSGLFSFFGPTAQRSHQYGVCSAWAKPTPYGFSPTLLRRSVICFCR